MTDYGSIQRFYDKQLEMNKDWSVFVLPERHPYFNTFLPKSRIPYLEKDEIADYLTNMLFIYDDDLIERPKLRRLVNHYDLFSKHFTVEGFVDFCEMLCDNHSKGLSVFKPNAYLSSIRNPHYRFDSRMSNPEKQKIRNAHRSILRNKYNGGSYYDLVHDTLSDYDLNDGLITKSYLYKEVGISRYYIDEVLRQNPNLVDMYDALRKTTRK